MDLPFTSIIYYNDATNLSLQVELRLPVVAALSPPQMPAAARGSYMMEETLPSTVLPSPPPLPPPW